LELVEAEEVAEREQWEQLELVALVVGQGVLFL
jgi:hypothetical protein